MKIYEFVCEKHEEYGTNGWRLKSMPDFDPATGITVAHDILEHFPNGNESPADEFRALGACLLVRGSGFGEFNGSIGENIAADLPDIFAHISNGMRLAVPHRTCKSAADEDISDTIRAFRKELKYMDLGFSRSEINAMLEHVRGWMRIGYSQAKRRYKGRLGEARCLFRLIEADADEHLKQAELGDMLTMRVNVRRCNVECEVLESWEDEAA